MPCHPSISFGRMRKSKASQESASDSFVCHRLPRLCCICVATTSGFPPSKIFAIELLAMGGGFCTIQPLQYQQLSRNSRHLPGKFYSIPFGEKQLASARAFPAQGARSTQDPGQPGLVQMHAVQGTLSSVSSVPRADPCSADARFLSQRGCHVAREASSIATASGVCVQRHVQALCRRLGWRRRQ